MILDTMKNGKPVTIEENLRPVLVLAEPEPFTRPTDRNRRVSGEAKGESPERESKEAIPPEQAARNQDSRGRSQSLTGKPVKEALDFSLAFISALRSKYKDDPMVTRPLTCEEIAELSYLINAEVGRRGCTKQNISRIEQIAFRRLRCNQELKSFLQEILEK